EPIQATRWGSPLGPAAVPTRPPALGAPGRMRSPQTPPQPRRPAARVHLPVFSVAGDGLPSQDDNRRSVGDPHLTHARLPPKPRPARTETAKRRIGRGNQEIPRGTHRRPGLPAPAIGVAARTTSPRRLVSSPARNPGGLSATPPTLPPVFQSSSAPFCVPFL